MTEKTNAIQCSQCKTNNTLKKNQRLELKQSPKCKECHEELFQYFRKPFLDLHADSYIHNLDRQMLEALRKIPGIDTVLRGLLRHSLELSMRLHHQGNFVQASEKQLKSLHDKLLIAASILDINAMPELYVVQDSRVNAYTFGVEKCSIAISSGCLELLSDEEVLCVLAHELGHIKAHHVLYKTASRILATLADSIAQKTLGLGGLMLYPLQLALLRWDRASELSSDRAALLVVKNPMTVLNAMMKLAGGSNALMSELNIDAFIEQAENFEKTQDEGPLGKYIAVMNSMFNTHPFPIWRAREIIDWVDSGEYYKLLTGDFLKKKKFEPRTCPSCGSLQGADLRCEICYEKGPTETKQSDKIEKALDGLKTWYNKNFNLPEDR